MTGVTGLAARIAVPAVVKSVPWKLIFDGAIAFAFLALIGWSLRINDLRGRWQHQYQSEHAGRLADRATYTKAQADAAALNKVQVAATVAKQEKINHETVSTLSARLELIRSELRKASAAPASPASGAGSGQASPTASGTACPACLLITPEERLRGAEDEERHQQLIDWVLKQSKVDPNE